MVTIIIFPQPEVYVIPSADFFLGEMFNAEGDLTSSTVVGGTAKQQRGALARDGIVPVKTFLRQSSVSSLKMSDQAKVEKVSPASPYTERRKLSISPIPPRKSSKAPATSSSSATAALSALGSPSIGPSTPFLPREAWISLGNGWFQATRV